MICCNCGLYNPDESRFCTKCRQPFVTAAQITERRAAHSKKERLVQGLFFCVVLLIVLAIAIPNFIGPPNDDAHVSPRGFVRTLISAEITYASQYRAYASLQDLSRVGLIDNVLGSGTVGGYKYFIADSEGELPQKTYTIMAYPLQPSRGQHTYCAKLPAPNEAGDAVIHIADPSASLETCLQSRTLP